MTSLIPDWLYRLYPFEPKSFQTPSGAMMRYLDEGGESDEAVLLLHGNPTWSFYYSELVQTLSPHIRCIAPDHIGMGLSEKPRDYPYTLQTRIEDIRALVASLGLKKIHLVLHDWGGAIGFGFATYQPDNIGRIVLMNTAAYTSSHIPKRIALCRSSWPGTLLTRRFNAFARPALSMCMHRRPLSKDEARAFLFPYDSYANRVAIDGFVKDIPLSPKHPSWDTLLTIENKLYVFKKNPALIIWGGQDFCFDDSFYIEWRKRLPQARANYLSDAGHYVLADADAEVIPQITAFLTT